MREYGKVLGAVLLFVAIVGPSSGSLEAREESFRFRLVPEQFSKSGGMMPSGMCIGALQTETAMLRLECRHTFTGEVRAEIRNVLPTGRNEITHLSEASENPLLMSFLLGSEEVGALVAGDLEISLASLSSSFEQITGRIRADAIFSDGFESGAACYWSSSTEDLCDVVFVATWGDGTGDGSIGAPMDSIQDGIDAAVAQTRSQVWVAAGGYFEEVSLASDVEVLAGYSVDFAERDTELYEVFLFAETASGSPPGAVNAVGITGGTAGSTAFDGFTVFAAAGSSAGQSSYGIYLSDVDASVSITNNRVYGERGADGSSGDPGLDGEIGAPGSPGVGAYDLNEAFGVMGHGCLPAHHSSGGSGGSSMCPDLNADGGSGGNRVCPSWDSVLMQTDPPVSSENGLNSPGGAIGGAAGWNVYQQAFGCLGYETYGALEGGAGVDGTGGNDGSNGSACGSPGSVMGGLWVPGVCGSGGPGDSGIGGGGGGAGAGAWLHSSCIGPDWGTDNIGGTAGGGGSGGCRGGGGEGGTSGDGSFAVFVTFSSPPATLPEIAGNTLFTGQGGRGGDGGWGGIGGQRGLGGPGGAGGGDHSTPDADYPAFAGGRGGDGGDGGHGGGGAGGDGGPSYGIYAHNYGGLDPSLWSSANSFVLSGSGGAGGAGGLSMGNPGAAGNNGAAAATNF